MRPQKFTKSKLMTGLQCDKAFYLQMHHPRLARPNTLAEERVFRQGHLVGERAHTLFPHGKKIEFPVWEYEKSVKATLDLMEQKCSAIFEASFDYENFFARIDILAFSNDRWDVIEVKSSTQAKDEHITDIAIQAFILKKLKIPINKYYLLHINNQCTFPHLNDFFTQVDLTEQVLNKLSEIEKNVKHLKDIFSSKLIPEVDIGPHCLAPYECRFKDHCWGGQLLPNPNIFHIPGLREKKWKFLSSGILSIFDVPVEELSESQKVSVTVLRTGEPFINLQSLESFIKNLAWPVYYLDFETLAPAIPQFEGLRPYMNYPFQYSCHVQHKDKEQLNHFEYLHTDKSDPRRALALHMCKNIGKTGSIISYNKSFEGSCLRDLADQFPDLKNQLLDFETRLVDPLPLIREAVYFPEFEDSYSLKSVGPALIGDQWDYGNIAIQDGTMAQECFEKMIIEPDTKIKQKLIQQLKEYCNRDTLVMVKIIEWMQKQVNKY